MKVCVTGGTGFRGAHLVPVLCERGNDVDVAYRAPGRLDAVAAFDASGSGGHRGLRRAPARPPGQRGRSAPPIRRSGWG